MQQFIETNSNWIIPLLAWLIPTVLTPVFRKIPPKNILIVLRMLVGIFDKIQPQQFKETAVTAKVVADTKAALKSTTITMLIGCALLLGGCGHTQLVAATTSSGHNYQYCLEVTYPVYVATADALFCGGLDQVNAQKAKLEKECPAKTFAIVPAK